MTKFWRTV